MEMPIVSKTCSRAALMITKFASDDLNLKNNHIEAKCAEKCAETVAVIFYWREKSE